MPSLPRKPLAPFRPPAVPLIAHDPYFSVWSMADRLTDDATRHWTGKVQAIGGLIRVDREARRLIGPEPTEVPALEQVGLEVLPTRTVYRFRGAGIAVDLEFLSPLFPWDLDVLARPVTYLTWKVRSIDGLPHRVSAYLDVSAAIAVDRAEAEVTGDRRRVDGLEVIRLGSRAQEVLAKAGDDLRIDWGYFHLAVPGPGARCAISSAAEARRSFAATGSPPAVDVALPRAAGDGWPAAACAIDLGDVDGGGAERAVLLAYDDIWSIEHMGERLRPWWRRRSPDADALLRAALRDRPALDARGTEFDGDLVADLEDAGGEAYARLGALAFRQCLAAHKLVEGRGGRPILFSKENQSNGCIATVDVTYPSAPFFLLFNPALLAAQLEPVLDYARSPRWPHPFAPHDLGTYPRANGQVYGGGEASADGQMPVEECGNMLVLAAALALRTGEPDIALRFWPLLSGWAGYLRAKGQDPEDQLCTDDFAGRLAGNTNLSLKAIIALGAYARLCRMVGSDEEADDFRKAAAAMAATWMDRAADGDHYRLAFDRPGTWSQKYNLIWDRLLGLDLFPPEVARAEVAFYAERLERYGLPLDGRSPYTKLDWCAWTAALTGSREELARFIAPLHDFAQETPDRVPLTDWFWAHDGKKAGFQARSVVGGIFLPLLADSEVAAKWARRAIAERPAAPAPRRPRVPSHGAPPPGPEPRRSGERPPMVRPNPADRPAGR